MRFRLGIYGGTFDPPHYGHIRAAQSFLREAKLDALYIMPAAIPPHKQTDPGSSPEIRLALTHAAFDGLDARITVSDYEIRSEGVSYTYKTLTHFAGMTDAELFFLCGTDMFLTLDTWRHPEIIFALASVACVMREDDRRADEAVADAIARYEAQYGARTFVVDHTPLELSSSQIRQILADGCDTSPYIPEAVHRIIDAYGLYRGE